MNSFERNKDVKAQNMKRIILFATSSWWTSSRIRIMKNKKKIEKNHKKQLDTNAINYIYIDESDINDKIEIATISSKTNSITSKTYLRLITSYTIYSTKLYEIILITNMKLYSFIEKTKKSKLVICIDNQTIIQAIHNSKINFDQYLMKWIIWLIDDLRRKNIELHWVSIYIDMKSNEQTNIVVKQITNWKLKERRDKQKKMNTNQIVSQTQLMRMLKNAIKITMNKRMQQQWVEKWRNCNKDRKLHLIITKSNKTIMQLHDKLTKKLNAITIQFHMIKIDLQTFFYNKKLIENSMCSYKRDKQTMKHVLFECNKLKKFRKKLWIDEIRKTKWKKLKLTNVLIKSINLKKTTTLIEKFEFIDYLKISIENDEI